MQSLQHASAHILHNPSQWQHSMFCLMLTTQLLMPLYNLPAKHATVWTGGILLSFIIFFATSLCEDRLITTQTMGTAIKT
jgi:uncharacterized membrane protein